MILLLKNLTELGILQKVTKGRNHYFINTALFQILTSLPELSDKKEEGERAGLGS